MIVVSGATGTVGKEVVRTLRELKAKFKVLSRNTKKATEVLGAVEIVNGDFDDPTSIEKALTGADAFFLLVNGSQSQVNQESSAVAAAKKAGVKRIVYLSVQGADENSPINFGAWHGKVEKVIKASDLEWTMIQPAFFMQNTLGNAGTIAADSKIYAPMKSAKFAPIDARDIGAVAARILTSNGHGGKTYLLTGG